MVFYRDEEPEAVHVRCPAAEDSSCGHDDAQRDDDKGRVVEDRLRGRRGGGKQTRQQNTGRVRQQKPSHSQQGQPRHLDKTVAIRNPQTQIEGLTT